MSSNIKVHKYVSTYSIRDMDDKDKTQKYWNKTRTIMNIRRGNEDTYVRVTYLIVIAAGLH